MLCALRNQTAPYENEKGSADKLVDKWVERLGRVLPVSYTHLDVYKRQALLWAGVSASACASREAASEEASLSAMAEAEVSSAGELLAAPPPWAAPAVVPTGSTVMTTGRSASASRVSSPLMLSLIHI